MSLENSIVSILSEAQCGLHHHQKLLKSLRYMYICTYTYNYALATC